MANILIIADTFLPNRGGSEAYLAVLADGLAANGHSVNVFTPAATSSEPCLEFHPNVSIHRSRVWKNLHRWGGHRSPLVNRLSRLLIFPWLATWLAGRKADVVIAGHILPAGIVARFLRRLNRCRATVVITYGEEITMYRRSSRMLKLMQKTLKSAGAVTALTSDSKNELELICPGTAEKSFIVPPAVDLEIAEDGLNDEITGEPILFTISRLVERKGIDTTIQAVALLKDEFPSIMYYIAGLGPDAERLASLARELGVNERVKLLGSVADPAGYFSSADIFCMPNRMLDSGEREGFGIVFLEAGLYGVPSIAGRSGGAVDAVLHEKTGLVVTPDDPAEVAAAIRTLVDDPEYRRELGVAAKAYAREFTSQRQVASFEKIISIVMSSEAH